MNIKPRENLYFLCNIDKTDDHPLNKVSHIGTFAPRSQTGQYAQLSKLSQYRMKLLNVFINDNKMLSTAELDGKFLDTLESLRTL